LVNDGSKDASWPVAKALAQQYPWVFALNLSKNSGQHVALLNGCKFARGSIIVTLDDDLQHPPEEIPKLLQKLFDSDVAYGIPNIEEHSFWRRLSSRAAKFVLQRVIGIQRAEDTSAFRAVKAELFKPFSSYDSHYVDIDALLSWVTDQFTSVRVRHDPRAIGQSNYTLWSLLQHTLKMILCFTTLPLRIASLIGFLFTLFGLTALIYVLVNYYFYRGSIPGFAFLACTISIFSGAQLFALGVLGEYFSKLHFRIMGRPGGFVREIYTQAPRTQ